MEEVGGRKAVGGQGKRFSVSRASSCDPFYSGKKEEGTIRQQRSELCELGGEMEYASKDRGGEVIQGHT